MGRIRRATGFSAASVKYLLIRYDRKGLTLKAMADYLYFVHLGKKSLNDRIRCDRLNG